MTFKWEEVKEPILQLYITQDKSLCDVMAILEERYGFKAGERTFQKHLKRWGFTKGSRKNRGMPCRAQPSTRNGSEAEPVITRPEALLGVIPFVSRWFEDSIDSFPPSVPITQSHLLSDEPVGLTDRPGSHAPCDNRHTPMTVDWNLAESPEITFERELKSNPVAVGRATAYRNLHNNAEYMALYRKCLDEVKENVGNDFERDSLIELAAAEMCLKMLPYEHHPLLLCCSFLDGKSISLELLSRLSDITRARIDQLVDKLLQYELITQVPLSKEISIPFNLQSWLQRRLPSPQHCLDAESDLIRKLSKSIVLTSKSTRQDWDFAKKSIPHLDIILTLIVRKDSEQFWTEDLFRAATKLADVARRLQINKSVLPVLEHLHQLMERSLGGNHPLTLDTLNSLSVTYMTTKNWPEAERLLRKLIRCRQESQTRNELCYITELNNFIRVLIKQGATTEARTLKTTVADAVKRLVPRSHLEKMKAEIKLAECLRYCGDLAEAEAHFLRIHKEAEEFLGKTSPHTLRVFEFLCHVYFDQEAWANAARYGQELIGLSKRSLGECQVDTVRRIAFLKEVDRQRSG